MPRNPYNSNSEEPFRISRSKIELFLECPRCFYLEVKSGVPRPKGFPFTLNNAVDILLKKEFDTHRVKGESHPLMEHYHIKAVPFNTVMINEWRNPFKGVQHLHVPTNFLVFGAIDDVWINDDKELIVVDYKATSSEFGIDPNAQWRDGYKRQVEIYQWLLRRNEFKVSETAYFVYANGRKDRAAFDKKLEFDIEIISHKGKDEWIEPKLFEIKKCLDSEDLPLPSSNCEYCLYRLLSQKEEKSNI